MQAKSKNINIDLILFDLRYLFTGFIPLKVGFTSIIFPFASNFILSCRLRDESHLCHPWSLLLDRWSDDIPGTTHLFPEFEELSYVLSQKCWFPGRAELLCFFQELSVSEWRVAGCIANLIIRASGIIFRPHKYRFRCGKLQMFLHESMSMLKVFRVFIFREIMSSFTQRRPCTHFPSTDSFCRFSDQ